MRIKEGRTRMLGGRSTWATILRRQIRHWQYRQFCDNNPTSLTKHPHNSNGSSSYGGRRNGTRDLEGYRDLDKLDFTKAAKILFSDPPKKKRLGLDFHLVQLFFALLPSLAVYLVAQYARYEMRKREAELEEKKKVEEEEKAKEIAKIVEEEKLLQGSDPELLEVKERLEALEEKLKEIVGEIKKQPVGEKIKTEDENQERENPKRNSDDSRGAVEKQQTPPPGLSQQQKQHKDSEKPGSHQEEKK